MRGFLYSYLLQFHFCFQSVLNIFWPISGKGVSVILANPILPVLQKICVERPLKKYRQKIWSNSYRVAGPLRDTI